MLTSPGHPNSYPNNLDTKDIITVNQERVISIEFTAFNVEEKDATDCYDHVRIMDGDGTQLMFWCGTEVPGIFTSNTNTVRITFHTDGSNTRSGWRLRWTAQTPGLV